MKGSFYKRGKTWTYKVDIGRDSKTGKRLQKAVGGFKTKREAQVAAMKVMNEVESGTYLEPSQEWFKDYIHRWYHEYYKREVLITTYESRQYIVTDHLIPTFGEKKLSDLTTFDIDVFYIKKLDEGYSAEYIRNMHYILKRSLDQAVKWKMIKFNPCLEASPPKVNMKEKKIWNKEQTLKFLEVCKGEQKFIPYVLAIYCGLRRGEVLGLKWSDIDYNDNTLFVQRSLAYTSQGLIFKKPKTKKSKRKISLSNYVLKQLEEHRELQVKFKDSFGDKYEDNDLIISSFNESPKDPNNLLREYNHLIKLAEVPKISFHDLRHAFASFMLETGENPKVISEMLGHSRVAITLDIYSHVNIESQKKAVNNLERYLNS